MAYKCAWILFLCFDSAVFMSTTQASPWAVSHSVPLTAGNDRVFVSCPGPSPELSVLTAG